MERASSGAVAGGGGARGRGRNADRSDSIEGGRPGVDLQFQRDGIADLEIAGVAAHLGATGRGSRAGLRAVPVTAGIRVCVASAFTGCETLNVFVILSEAKNLSWP